MLCFSRLSSPLPTLWTVRLYADEISAQSEATTKPASVSIAPTRRASEASSGTPIITADTRRASEASSGTRAACRTRIRRAVQVQDEEEEEKDEDEEKERNKSEQSKLRHPHHHSRYEKSEQSKLRHPHHHSRYEKSERSKLRHQTSGVKPRSGARGAAAPWPERRARKTRVVRGNAPNPSSKSWRSQVWIGIKWSG